jgi:hypothetical protein
MRHEFTHLASPSHQAVLAMVRIALSNELNFCEMALLWNRANPHVVAQIANQNQIHTILKSAFDVFPELSAYFPKDLVLYFSLIYQENAKRNHNALEELAILGKLFDEAGIKAVVLKGGAEMISPCYQDPAHRFISDLDILIPEDSIQKAAKILYERGGKADASSHYFYDHHHLPVISGGELPFRIELHKRIGSCISDQLLPAEEMLARSVASNITGIRIPSLEDRFLHHLLHAQLRGGLYERCMLNLRHCVDHFYFTKVLTEGSHGAVKAKLHEYGLHNHIEALDLLTSWIFQVEAPLVRDKAQKWAKVTLRNFGQPKRQKFRDSWVWLKRYLIHFMTDADRRQIYLRKLLSRRGWAQIIAFHKERWQRFI